jgi:hypothetical protein
MEEEGLQNSEKDYLHKAVRRKPISSDRGGDMDSHPRIENLLRPWLLMLERAQVNIECVIEMLVTSHPSSVWLKANS